MTAAQGTVDKVKGEIAAQQLKIDAEDGKVAAAILACKGTKYDQYRLDVTKAANERQSALQLVERFLDGKKAIAHGATGGRCEKPQSNGDHLRRGKCAADTDCCGAASGYPHGKDGPKVTIEVCQPKESKTYKFIPMRKPLKNADEAGADWKFKCIGGASKLAGATLAALASAYMMA